MQDHLCHIDVLGELLVPPGRHHRFQGPLAVVSLNLPVSPALRVPQRLQLQRLHQHTAWPHRNSLYPVSKLETALPANPGISKEWRSMKPKLYSPAWQGSRKDPHTTSQAVAIHQVSPGFPACRSSLDPANHTENLFPEEELGQRTL